MMNLHSIDRRLVAFAAFAILLVLAATAARVTHADSATPPRNVEPDVPGPPPDVVYPPAASAADAAAGHAAFAQRFSLFRGSETAVLATVVVRDPGIDRTAARDVSLASDAALARAGATAPRSQVWIAPRYDGTECILAMSPGASGPGEVCNSADQAADGYLVSTNSASDEDVEIYGLVPDGVDQVTVTLRDGSRSELPVVDNVYAAHVTQPTEAIEFTDAAGGQHELPMRSEA